MQVKKTTDSPTSTNLSFVLDEADLKPIKQHVIAEQGKNLKLPGFRAGKAPEGIIEKNLDQSLLQTDVIEHSINRYYSQAIDQEKLRPVSQPEISIMKFVPFTTLEFTAKVEVVGDIKLGDYKNIKKNKPTVSVTDKDIDEVIDTLKSRMAERKDVDRAAKNTDQVLIDFKGVDAKGEPIKGADGKGYPLILGSDAFIPGFEKNLVGMKAGEEKSFDLTFPKEYSVKALANKKVTFTVKVEKVQETIEPKVDDDFAAKAGPFKTLKDLKADIKTQLTGERQYTADRDFEQEIIQEITKKSKVSVPQGLVEEQAEAMLRELKQNLAYRGQTYEEYLENEGVDEEKYRKEELLPKAEERVKAGLVLSEIAEEEKLTVTPEELEIRIQLLRGQYQDPAMQAELDKQENRRDIAMRILTEKTFQKLTGYVSGNN